MSNTPRTNALKLAIISGEADSAEMIDLAESLENELAKERRRADFYLMEKAKYAAMFEHCCSHLSRIHMFVHPDGIAVEGKIYSFHPPEGLVREAWEELSKAIREVPNAIIWQAAYAAGREAERERCATMQR